MNGIGRKILRLSASTALIISVSAPLAAETLRTEGPPPDDPVMQWADALLPRNEFVLNSDQDVELIRYKTPRDIEICIGRADPGAIEAGKLLDAVIIWG